LHYGVSTGTPTSAGYEYADECLDETQLAPWLPLTVGAPDITITQAAGVSHTTDTNYVRWALHGTSMLIQWENPVSAICAICAILHFITLPYIKTFKKKKANSKANLVKTLLQAYNNETASSFTNTSNLISLPNPNEWVYVVITEAFLPVTHPIHLHGHGHGFFMLPSGTGTYDPTTTTLNLQNPPSRDVVLLP
jgi:hypothetical protein